MEKLNQLINLLDLTSLQSSLFEVAVRDAATHPSEHADLALANDLLDIKRILDVLEELKTDNQA